MDERADGPGDGPDGSDERRPDPETDVDGRSRTPTDVAIGVGIAAGAMFVFGFVGLSRWIAYPAGLVIGLAAWQLLAGLRRRRARSRPGGDVDSRGS